MGDESDGRDERDGRDQRGAVHSMAGQSMLGGGAEDGPPAFGVGAAVLDVGGVFLGEAAEEALDAAVFEDFEGGFVLGVFIVGEDGLEFLGFSDPDAGGDFGC